MPALQSARDWLDVLRRRGAPEAAAVPAWVKPVAPSIAPAAASGARPSAPWQAVRAAGGLTLSGSAPSAEARARMVAEAGKRLAPLAVKDRMTINEAAAGIEPMARRLRPSREARPRHRQRRRWPLHAHWNRPEGDRPRGGPRCANALPSGFTLDRLDITKPAPRQSADEAELDGERPMGIEGPRGGKADDLKRIRGIGPQNEGRLHGLGIWHFDQIAAWTTDNALWVGSYLAFPGRIEREDWVGQAKLLAAGAETEFSKRVDKGEVASSRDDGSLGAGNVEAIAPLRAVEGAPPKARGKKPKG